jgi:DNA repair photolyase
MEAKKRRIWGVGIADLAAQGSLLAANRRVDYFELPTRRLLNRTTKRMPFAWTINPYRGCEFGCVYCYARYTHEFMELDPVRGFEDRIYAKKTVEGALREELRRVARDEAIAIGTVADPYQPAERRFGVTRAILEVFAAGRGRRLSIATKSDLIVRDVDLLQAISRANVFHAYITITTVDEELARRLEPRAPRPALRLEAVRRLADAGVTVGVFANPMMPLLNDGQESMEALGAAIAGAGASFVLSGPLFLKPCARAVFFPFLDRRFPELLPQYRALYRERAFLRGEYAERVQERVGRMCARYGLASAPAERTPELWPPEPRQGELFELQ